MIRRVSVSALAAALAAVVFLAPAPVGAQAGLPTPEQFAGHPIGADNKLVRWDRIVEYMKLAAQATDRVRLRELGKSTNGQPFIALEISAPDTLKHIDRYKELERKLYFQGGAPTDAERDEIFRSGKAVVLVTCSIHATEIGASQMTLELVHRLATDDSPATKKVLDNVIFILVPSLNPDGQIMVTDWFNKNAGTEFANSPIPFLYHPYVGHDNNRDMYMFTQQESRLTARLLWNDWYPSVWLDEHQMGSNGARIFVMPATDPINPNVHPLIYRWNGILGQSQAAALEAAGKEGIIYNSTYTNFWQGAMAWSGWWHNQVGLLTEVASVRVAAPIEQQRAQRGVPPQPNAAAGGRGRGGNAGGVLPPPTDVNPRTEYPRPWVGGRWTLRDIVDYELIATIGLLETAADRRETLLRQIYEVNRETVEAGRRGDPAAILIPVEGQHDPRQAGHLVEKLQMAGVDVHRARSAFEADGIRYGAGTFVVPMAQVFARYARDILERQTYPEVRRAPNAPPEPPYDVSAWSLGMLMGVEHVVVKSPLPATVAMEKLGAAPAVAGKIEGSGTALLVRLSRSGRRARHQPAARRRCGSIDRHWARRWTADRTGRRHRRSARLARKSRRRSRIHPQVRVAGPWRLGDQGASDRDVRHLERRQHGRRLDALGAGAVRVPLHAPAQRRRQGRRALRQVRRDHPAGSESQLDPRREYGEHDPS